MARFCYLRMEAKGSPKCELRSSVSSALDLLPLRLDFLLRIRWGDWSRWGSGTQEFGKAESPKGPSKRARASHWVRVRCRTDAPAFADFAELARRSINPNLADAAVEEMQALLTERL